jgi:hypothetical protein
MTAKNVFQYYKEGEKDFQDRLSRTYRANHTKRVVDTVNLHLFKQPVQRDAATAPKALAAFWSDPCGDGQGDMTRLAKEIDQWLSVYGLVYVVVDNTPFEGESAEAAAASRPYAYILHPQRVQDLAFDGQGEILWATVAEDRRDDLDPFASSGKMMVDVRLWTRERWYLFAKASADNDAPYELKEEGKNALGKVPIVPVRAEHGTAYSAPALIGDIVYMDRALVNYGSALDEIIYGQTFSQLAVPATGILPGSTGYGHALEASRKRVFLYDTSSGDAGAKPFYLSPDASQANLILDAMQVLMRNIYSVTGTDNEANSQSMSKGKEYASGVVRAFDYSSIENMLVNKSKALEAAEEKIAALVLAYAGEPEIDADALRNLIKYPSSFDIRGLESDLAVAKALHDIQGPGGLLRRHLRGVGEKLLPRLSDAERQDLAGEIDGWQPAAEFDRELKRQDMELKEKQAAKPPPAPVAKKGAI